VAKTTKKVKQATIVSKLIFSSSSLTFSFSAAFAEETAAARVMSLMIWTAPAIFIPSFFF
jgi:hypothetical protein